MSLIAITDLTNKTDSVPGTGTFDLLMASVNLQLQDQWDEGRITGAEFGTVYLGAMQAVMQQSVSFLLQKQEADKKAELLDAQINEVNERIDLVIAQTAESYESIKASQSRTLRENLLNNRNIEKIIEETDLLKSKDLEEIENTLRLTAQSDAKITDINYDISIKAQQEFNLKDKNGGVVTTYTYYLDGTGDDPATGETTVLGDVEGSVISTTTADGTSASVVALDKEVLIAKEELVNAQTLGFVSDTKQKMLKQMFDNYAVNLSVAGIGNVPEAAQDAAIDALVQELLDDIGSTVTIGAELTPPLPDA